MGSSLRRQTRGLVCGYFWIFSRFTSSGFKGRPIKKHDLHCCYVGAPQESLPSISMWAQLPSTGTASFVVPHTWSALTHPPFSFPRPWILAWLLRFFTRVLLQSTLSVERSVCTFVVGSFQWGEWISFIFVTREREGIVNHSPSLYV